MSGNASLSMAADSPGGLPEVVCHAVPELASLTAAPCRNRTVLQHRCGVQASSRKALHLSICAAVASVSDWVHTLNLILMLLAVVLTVGSGVIYLYEAWKLNQANAADAAAAAKGSDR